MDQGNILNYLLDVQPQPEMSIYDFWSFAVKQMLVQGNAYIYPRYVMGELTDLVLCSNDTVNHDTINELYEITDPYNGVFGVQMKRMDDTTLIARVNVQISPTFFGWVFQFAGKMRIVKPESVAEQFHNLR